MMTVRGYICVCVFLKRPHWCISHKYVLISPITQNTLHIAHCFVTVFSLDNSSGPEWGPSSGHHTKT